MHDKVLGSTISMVDSTSIRREADAIGQPYIPVELYHFPFCIDPPQFARDTGAGLERVRPQRTNIDSAGTVSEKVIEAGNVIPLKEDASLAVFDVTHVLA